MNTPVPPTPPSNGLQQAPATQSGTIGTVIQSALPPNALRLGQVLLGTVLNQTAAGQFLIQTNSGKLTIQTAANLLSGSTISIQFQKLGVRPQIMVVSLPTQNRNAPSPTSNNQPLITSILTQGSTVAATITRTSISTATPNAGPPHGAGITIGTTDISRANVGVTATNTATASTSTHNGNISTSSFKTVPNTAQSSPMLSAGTTFNLRILSVTPPGSNNAQVSSSTGSGTLTGTVTQTTQSGQTVVQTNRGEIVLDSHTALPRGTQLSMRLVSTPLALMEGMDGSSLLLSRQWETLRHAIAALQASNPTVARNFTQQVLPQAGGALTTGILFFLSAVITGDLRRWLGEDAERSLQRSAGNLLERLGRDIGEMQRMASEPSGQEWRSYLIPILVGTDLQHLKLFVRGEKEHDEAKSGDNKRDTRFVIEVEFSKLGPFQFDGLTRDKNIDLMVRTRDTIADDIRDDIRAIFSNTISALGFTGTLNFQQTLSFELNPTQEINERQGGLTV